METTEKPLSAAQAKQLSDEDIDYRLQLEERTRVTGGSGAEVGLGAGHRALGTPGCYRAVPLNAGS